MQTHGVCEDACMCVCDSTGQTQVWVWVERVQFKHNWKRQTLGVQKPMILHFLNELLCSCGLSKPLICKEAIDGHQEERTGTNGSHWERHLKHMLLLYLWMEKHKVREGVSVSKMCLVTLRAGDLQGPMWGDSWKHFSSFTILSLPTLRF